MMLNHISVRWLALMVSVLLVGTQIAADERPGKHTHDDTAPHGKPVEGHGHTMDGPHQHPWWETPPAEYANARSTRWDDAAAIARGQQLYQTYCLMCHGADGQAFHRDNDMKWTENTVIAIVRGFAVASLS